MAYHTHVPVHYGATNNTWFNLLTSKTQIDVSSIFQVPADLFMNEIVGNKELSNYFTDNRSQTERQKIATLNVGMKVGGSGTQYVDSSTNWLSLSLFNGDGNPRHVIVKDFYTCHTGEEYKHTLRLLSKHQFTLAALLVPSIKKWIEDNLQPYFYLSFVRLLILKSGGMVPPHTDIPIEVKDLNQDGYICSYNNLNSFSISLNEPEGCYFYHDNRLIPFKSGAAFWLNVGRKHWLTNMSKKDRYHLQFQGLYKKRFRDLIVSKADRLDCYPK